MLYLVALFLMSLRADAEEEGAGHYTPGATASFIDALPGYPSLAVEDVFTYYHGNVSALQPLPDGGLRTLGLDATAYVDSFVAIYESPLIMFGGNYATGVVVPYVWMEARAVVSGPIGSLSHRDTANGVGDIEFFPFMLGWTNGTGLKYDIRFATYTPSGEFHAGDLANVGKNYWTFEPSASLSYLSTKIGLEFSTFAGFDINTKNNATEYQTGTEFHLDSTLAEHVPLFGGAIGLGANGFYYQQITGDSGSGAILGPFEGRTVGVGPVLSYLRKVGKTTIAAEVKWLPELTAENRLKVDYVWFKLVIVY